MASGRLPRNQTGRVPDFEITRTSSTVAIPRMLAEIEMSASVTEECLVASNSSRPLICFKRSTSFKMLL